MDFFERHLSLFDKWRRNIQGIPVTGEILFGFTSIELVGYRPLLKKYSSKNKFDFDLIRSNLLNIVYYSRNTRQKINSILI
ncbi:unnamed protein product [Rotaria socialis]